MRIRQNLFVVAGIVDPGSSVVAGVVRAGDSIVGFRSPTIHNLPRFDSEKCPVALRCAKRRDTPRWKNARRPQGGPLQIYSISNLSQASSRYSTRTSLPLPFSGPHFNRTG